MRAGTIGPTRSSRKLAFESLERRTLLATEVMQDFAYYDLSSFIEQPLNGDSEYVIRGLIWYHSLYAFYASAGSPVEITAGLPNNRFYSINFSVTGPGTSFFEQAVDHDSDSHRLVVHRFTAPESGVYHVAIWNIDTGGEGDYEISIKGAAKPRLELLEAPDPPIYYINDEPMMPEISARLSGIVLDPIFENTFHWTTTVSSEKDTFPNQIRTYAKTLSAKVENDTSYVPEFGDVIIGGSLSLDVTATIRSRTFAASTKDGPAYHILGTPPSDEDVVAYVESFDEPARYPAGANITYHELLLTIMKKESYGGKQFCGEGTPCNHVPGAPLFNVDPGDGGAGLFQITGPPPPTTAEVWDWRANVRAGVRIFNEKLMEAVGWIDGRPARRLLETIGVPTSTPVRPEADRISRDEMILREAVQRYNGGNAFVISDQHRLEVRPDGGRELVFSWKAREAAVYHIEILGPIGDSMSPRNVDSSDDKSIEKTPLFGSDGIRPLSVAGDSLTGKRFRKWGI